jgi:hypothetical protein
MPTCAGDEVLSIRRSKFLGIGIPYLLMVVILEFKPIF